MIDADNCLNLTDQAKTDLYTHHVPYGIASTSYHSTYLLYHTDFVSAYDIDLKLAIWTAYYHQGMTPAEVGVNIRQTVQ